MAHSVARTPPVFDARSITSARNLSQRAICDWQRLIFAQGSQANSVFLRGGGRRREPYLSSGGKEAVVAMSARTISSVKAFYSARSLRTGTAKAVVRTELAADANAGHVSGLLHERPGFKDRCQSFTC